MISLTEAQWQEMQAQLLEGAQAKEELATAKASHVRDRAVHVTELQKLDGTINTLTERLCRLGQKLTEVEKLYGAECVKNKSKSDYDFGDIFGEFLKEGLKK